MGDAFLRGAFPCDDRCTNACTPSMYIFCASYIYYFNSKCNGFLHKFVICIAQSTGGSTKIHEGHKFLCFLPNLCNHPLHSLHCTPEKPGNCHLIKISKMNSNIDAANLIRDQRVITKTKKSYLAKLKVLKKFLMDNEYGDTMIGQDGQIMLHIAAIDDQKEVLSAFFGWLATNTNLPRLRNHNGNDNIENDDTER
jgi:hypothetical protein